MEKKDKNGIKCFLLPSIVTFILTAIIIITSEWSLITRYQIPNFQAFSFVAITLFFLTAPFAMILLICSIIKRIRYKCLLNAAICLSHVCGIFISMTIVETMRKEAFQALERRSTVLIEAIEKFYKTNSRYPDTLDELVPNFIDEIPKTKLNAYPDYIYKKNEKDSPGNPWILYVDASRGGMNWDIFVYYPNQNYPVKDGAGYYERFGKWAYLHE